MLLHRPPLLYAIDNAHATTTSVSNYPSDDYCGILEGYFEATGNGEGDEADASSDDASRRGEVVTAFRLIA